MKVKVNKENKIENFYILDTDREIEIDDKFEEQLSEDMPDGYCWQYDESANEIYLVPVDNTETLRMRREQECFPIINRGALWYDLLTDEQKAELKAWYQAWLNVTETLVVPEKPDWLN